MEGGNKLDDFFLKRRLQFINQHRYGLYAPSPHPAKNTGRGSGLSTAIPANAQL